MNNLVSGLLLALLAIVCSIEVAPLASHWWLIGQAVIIITVIILLIKTTKG